MNGRATLGCVVATKLGLNVADLVVHHATCHVMDTTMMAVLLLAVILQRGVLMLILHPTITCLVAILQHGAPLQAVGMDQTATSTRTMKDTNTELTLAAILQHGGPLQAVGMDQTATRTMKDTNTELAMAAILQHGPRLHVVIASATNLALTITDVTTILISVLLTDDMVVFKLTKSKKSQGVWGTS